jgi:phenylalanyl-tRNA synthetase alpha chain
LSVTWTEIQKKRLKELDAGESHLDEAFATTSDRDRAYQELERALTKRGRESLRDFRELRLRPGLCRLESALVNALVQEGFAQVVTPIIMSKGLLAKMRIGDDHPLASDIFWLGGNKCLRPMLAPHLYFVLQDLLRLWEKPVRIFEVGPCFRKESEGAKHSTEFTMLNLVEMGLPMESRERRLEELAGLIAGAADIGEHRLQSCRSAVYGETIDVVAGEHGVELGSGAMGPHPLDQAWRIREPWVGIGFGLERLLMVAEGSQNLKRMGRSLSYLDGIRLNI